MENKVIVKNVESINDLLDFYTQLSFSNSFVLRTNNGQYDYQEYKNINEQHLYTISDFLKDTTLKEKNIILKKNNSDLELKYVFIEN